VEVRGEQRRELVGVVFYVCFLIVIVAPTIDIVTIITGIIPNASRSGVLLCSILSVLVLGLTLTPVSSAEDTKGRGIASFTSSKTTRNSLEYKYFFSNGVTSHSLSTVFSMTWSKVMLA
jgi:hypothetical protein